MPRSISIRRRWNPLAKLRRGHATQALSGSQTMQSKWIVYSRPGCGLCEEFMAALADLVGSELAAEVCVVDIDTDEALRRKYSERVPVLTVDGDFVCQYRLDAERVRRYVGP